MRRFLLGCCLLVALGGAAEATITRVQGASNTGFSGSLGATMGAAITGGNTVVGCVIYGQSETISSISDGTNTYTIAGTTSSGFASALASTFYKENVTGGPTTITVTLNAGSTIYLMADEFSGVSTTASTDGLAEGTANSVSGTNSFTSGNLSPTPTHNGDLIYGCSGTLEGATLSSGTGFTTAVNSSANNSYTEYLIQATAGTVAATFTPSATDFGWINAIALQAAAAPSAPPMRAMLGVGR